jgi:hypothetical protein
MTRLLPPFFDGNPAVPHVMVDGIAIRVWNVADLVTSLQADQPSPRSLKPPAPPAATLYRWRWRTCLPERHGQLFRVVARGKRNARLIEFEDGARYVAPGNALRRA